MENKIKRGIIGGGNLYHLSFLNEKKIEKIDTPYGDVFYFLIKNLPIILRHGIERKIPPHKINYLANIFAFKKLGVEKIYAFNSVGSLRKKIKPGMFLIPDSYINFETITFYDKECKHVVPGLSKLIRNDFINICQNFKFSFKKKGIYFQTKGPRYETKSEVCFLKNFAHVVGMTMGKEATLAREKNIDYASLNAIGNWANGVFKKPLSQKMVEKNESILNQKIEKIIKEILDK